MRKNSLFLMIVSLVFLFSVSNVSAKSSIFATPTSEMNVFEQSFESNNNPQRRYWLKITNNSRYDIYHLYVSSSENERWGPDQLDDDVMTNKGSFTITDITPGEYDIMFVDEDGDKCTLEDIGIFKNTNWSLTTAWLTNCEGY